MMKWLGIVIAVVFFSSCNSSIVVESSWQNELDKGWSENDRVAIIHPSNDTLDRFNLIVEIEHGAKFKWQNLYVEVGNITPSGDTLVTPVSLELADKRGQWQGDCSSTKCQADIVLKEHFYFPQTGNYNIWIEPYMRVDPVDNIERIQLRLEKSEKQTR